MTDEYDDRPDSIPAPGDDTTDTSATPAGEPAPPAGAGPPQGGAAQVPPHPPPETPGPPPPAGGPYPARYTGSPKPDQVTVIAVFDLVDGVLNVLFAASIIFGISIFGISTLGCGCLFLPLGIYPLVLGILEIIQGSRLLAAEPQEVSPARWLAVLQICNVLLGQVVSAAAGIITLILLDQPEVRRWFDERAPRQAAGYGGDVRR